MATLAQNIAEQIRMWRDEGGCSQGWLSSKSGATQSAVSRVESGRHLPTLRTLQRLAKPLNADVVVTLVRKDRTPLDGKLLDRIAAAMCDCHPDHGKGYRWADWIKQSKNKKLKPFEREMALEWIAYRRNEAKAALLVIQQTPGA
jgi:transcriptional regulator with XRE-family HTH domain